MKSRRRFTLLIALGLIISACTPELPAVESRAILTPTRIAPISLPTPTATAIAALPSPSPEVVRPDTLLVAPLESATPAVSPTPASALVADLCSPLAEQELAELPGIVSNPYNPPPPGREEHHQGVDFAYYNHNGRAEIRGEVVQALLPGRVGAALYASYPYGNVVIIATPVRWLAEDLQARLPAHDPEAELYSLFAHLGAAPMVTPGETVAACQPLGSAGASGNAAVAHLHLELRLGPPGASFAEMDYYRTSASEAARANYEAWRTGGGFQHFDPMQFLGVN